MVPDRWLKSTDIAFNGQCDRLSTETSGRYTMSKDKKPQETPTSPPKGSPVRDLADWGGGAENAPQAVKDYVEQMNEIPLPDLPDPLKDGD